MSQIHQRFLLRRELQAIVGNSRCLLLGSAPGAVLPPRNLFTRCVCVNGSAFIASQHDLSVDLTVFGGWGVTHAHNPNAKAFYKVRNLRGLSTRYLLFVRASASGARAKSVFQEFEFGFDHFRTVSREERKRIVEAVVGPLPIIPGDQEMVSNGAFALALLLWIGVKDVIIAGFSLEPGHSSLTPDIEPNETMRASEKRSHVLIDKYFFEQIASRFPRVSTTSESLSTQTGMGLIGVEK